MKRYKIDFNNGKVFEVEKREGDCCYKIDLINGDVIILGINELASMGATITEIEEPRREWFVCWDSEDHHKLAIESTCLPWTNKVKVVELCEGESICPAGSVAVSREKLAQLWKEYELGAWKGDTDTSVFKRFCEDLGL